MKSLTPTLVVALEEHNGLLMLSLKQNIQSGRLSKLYYAIFWINKLAYSLHQPNYPSFLQHDFNYSLSFGVLCLSSERSV